MRYTKPIRLRYSACFDLGNGREVDIQFDGLRDAVGFCKRISDSGEWWEVLDNKTNNVVASAKDDS